MSSKKRAHSGENGRAVIGSRGRLAAGLVSPVSGRIGACVLLALATGGGRMIWADDARSDARRPNILLVITDDQRPDTIHALGNGVIQTPTLDRLVREGMTFTRAIAPVPLCVPSRAEILTGCDAFRNGVRAFGGRMDPDRVLWPRAMRAAGYHTWHVGKWMNDGRPITRGYQESLGLFAAGGGRWAKDGVDCHGRPITGYRGWVFQSDDGRMFPQKGVGLTPDISRHFADAAIAFVRRRPAAPFFLHVNFTAPHDPLLIPPGYEGKYDPEKIPLPPNFLPEHPLDHGNLRGRDELLLPLPRTPEDVRQDLAAYYAVISHMDYHLGRILAALDETGQAGNTIVIFSSDHGLAMGSHGLRGKQNMYDHTVGVPLLFRGPGIPRGVTTDAPCYLRDLYPTVCDLAGIDVPKTVLGKSLAPVIRGETDAVRSCLFGYFRDCQRMIRTERWKLIWYPQIDRIQLFDLSVDPQEVHDRSQDPACAGVVADLRRRLTAWQEEVGDPLVQGRSGAGGQRRDGGPGPAGAEAPAGRTGPAKRADAP